MSSTDSQPVSHAAFNSSALFEPADGPGTVLITGTASNATYIANIQISDGGTPLASTGGFQSSNQSWGVIAALPAGKHIITATVTELSGASYTINSPYRLVTGIQNQPYVYQELDEDTSAAANRAGTYGAFTRISSYDGSGALVSQTAVAVGGGAAAPLSVAFDPTATFESSTAALLTGTTSAYGSTSTIEIFDGTAATTVSATDGTLLSTAKPLGYATLGTDGTWSFDAHVAPGNHVFTAVATGISGQVASSQSSFAIKAGVVGSPFVYQEIDHSASGAVAATTSYAADGTVVARSNDGGPTVNGGTSTAEVIRSAYDDVMTGDGTGNTTFLFRRGFGQDEITNFHYLSAAQSPTGIEHDVISLPQAVFTKMAQVMHHTTTALDGSAVIHLSPTDTIKLDGVTKAELITHPNVFRFHT
ncbi:hypothetical protein D3273_00545 [Lichenibacterium minor]|uniref:Bacterial Ig-like domain-containing protein n=1 Tax=Lichenibacterium minor TaxID=2316528 RepID=A0A4Q2UCG5_9HYPH|nr:hypothetical protein [Lichenibacterium minor]RYC33778.1 hypothetical protein D3273_00545 [Lichenibacterium minor]